MSYFLQIGANGGPSQIASNTGYGDFGRWAETLDPKKFPEVIHLYTYGWCQHLTALEKQLADAMKVAKPSASVADTIKTIIGLLSTAGAAECCTVTDGIGS